MTLDKFERDAQIKKDRKDKKASLFCDWSKYTIDSFCNLHSIDESKLCYWHINYLDDALTAILPGSLNVVAAPTGFGKTELVSGLCFFNARMKKKVFAFVLEGHRYEFVNRERYRRIAEKAWGLESKSLAIKLSYNGFIAGALREEIAGIWGQADEMKLREDFSTIKIFTRNEAVNKDTLVKQIELIKDEADIIVLDHLQYFDFQSASEHSEITDIMKRLKKLTDIHDVPVVLVSHLRKRDLKKAFPDNDDLHGSSNIAKQADTVILINHIATEDKSMEDQIATNTSATGFRITKCRGDNSPNIIGVVDFDKLRKKYEDHYDLYYLSFNEIHRLGIDKYPKWAKREVIVG